MSKYWILEPELADDFGDNTIMDASFHPPTVTKLHYRFQGWLGDELLECFPCFIVSRRVADDLSAGNFTGHELDNVEVTTEVEFSQLNPSLVLPAFRWLKVTGRPAEGDIAISDQHCLVVSDDELRCLRQHSLNHCEIHEHGGWQRKAGSGHRNSSGAATAPQLSEEPDEEARSQTFVAGTKKPAEAGPRPVRRDQAGAGATKPGAGRSRSCAGAGSP